MSMQLITYMCIYTRSCVCVSMRMSSTRAAVAFHVLARRPVLLGVTLTPAGGQQKVCASASGQCVP